MTRTRLHFLSLRLRLALIMWWSDCYLKMILGDLRGWNPKYPHASFQSLLQGVINVHAIHARDRLYPSKDEVARAVALLNTTCANAMPNSIVRLSYRAKRLFVTDYWKDSQGYDHVMNGTLGRVDDRSSVLFVHVGERPAVHPYATDADGIRQALDCAIAACDADGYLIPPDPKQEDWE